MAELFLAPRALPALARALCALIDAGEGGGRLKLFDRRGKDATLLATLTFARPCAAQAETEEIEFYALQDEPDAPNRGKAAWARIEDGDGALVLEGDVGERKGKTAFVIEDASIRKGDIVRVRALRLALRQVRERG